MAARYFQSLSCVAGGFGGPLGISCSSEFPGDCKETEGCHIKGLHVHLQIPLCALELLGKVLECLESPLKIAVITHIFWFVLHSNFGQEVPPAVMSPF